MIMEAAFAGIAATGALEVSSVDGSVVTVLRKRPPVPDPCSSSLTHTHLISSASLQATGELESSGEDVARLVYSMLQDANSIGRAQTAAPGEFQRLSSTQSKLRNGSRVPMPRAHCCCPFPARAAAPKHTTVGRP